LGVDRSFTDLRGIATAWRELVAWLDRRVHDGAPFRRLILPEIPVTWTHIGYTRYLSFPTRRDLRFLQKTLERNRQAANDPAALVRVLDPISRISAVSFGLKTAYQEFRSALRSGGASTDHRFWRLLLRAKAASGAKQPSPAELTMDFDEDGQRSFRVRTNGGEPAFVADLGKAVRAPALLESPNLGSSIRRGVLFFRSCGLATWSASGEPPAVGGSYHVAVADNQVRLTAGALVRFVNSGSWHVTADPVPSSTVSDLLRRLRIFDAKETVRSVGLVEGVHVGSSWLGSPLYLPHIEGAAGEIVIRQLSETASAAPKWADGRLSSDAPVEGEFSFEDRSVGWSRRASFVAHAEGHATMGSASYALQTLTEWKATSCTRVTEASSTAPVWMDDPYPLQDVLEAVYASSRSGIGEGDLIPLLSRAVGRRAWDLLRTLQESTFLDARLRERWRGRVFTLGCPELVRVAIEGRPAVIVSGAIPHRLEEDFRETVEAQGGVPFRHLNGDFMAPPLIGATGLDATRLAVALGWLASPRLPAKATSQRLLGIGRLGDFGWVRQACRRSPW
jgi:hypothetical protein